MTNPIKPNLVRKSISLDNEMWKEVIDFWHTEKIKSLSEAIRTLFRAGLDAISKKEET